MRILLNPNPAPESGAPPPSPAAPPPAAAPPAAPPAAASAPVPQTLITLTAEQYQAHLATQAELVRVKSEQAAALETERQKAVNALAAKGEIERALATERADNTKRLSDETAKLTALENQLQASALETAITTEIGATIFVSPAAAAHARDVLRNRHQTMRDPAGTIIVQEKGTMLPAAQSIKAWLASADADHFVKKSTSGGAGGGGSLLPSGGPPPEGLIAPTNPGQEAYAHFWTHANAQRQAGYGGIGIPGLPGAMPLGVNPTPQTVNPFDQGRRNN